MTQLLVGIYFLALAGASTFLVVLAVMTYKEGNKKKGIMTVIGLVAMLSAGYLLMSSNPIQMGQTVDGDSKFTNEKFLKKTSTRKDCARIELGTYSPSGESKQTWEDNCKNLDSLNLPDLTQEEKVSYETGMLETQIGYCEENEAGKNELFDNSSEEIQAKSKERCTEFRKQFETVQATGVTEW